LSGEEDPVSYFENLEPIDRIRSAAESSTYNCISWSGAITSFWCWPPSSGSPWHDSDPLTSFDNFYGNTPQARYSGAPNYTRSGATSSNNSIDLWATASGYTHGSIFRLGPDGNYHGYDWESKPGSLARIFHPRHSLNGSSYGSVVDYYRFAGTYSSSGTTSASEGILSLQESIDKGLTKIQEITFDKHHKDKLSYLLAQTPTKMATEFEKKYQAWKATWVEHKEMSNPRAYAESPEYELLVSFLGKHAKKAWPLIIEKHQTDGVIVINLIEDMMFKDNEAIMHRVRELNWKKSQERTDVYMVPTLNGNWIDFTKKIIESQL
jgi:hypothetical protein